MSTSRPAHWVSETPTVTLDPETVKFLEKQARMIQMATESMSSSPSLAAAARHAARGNANTPPSPEQPVIILETELDWS